MGRGGAALRLRPSSTRDKYISHITRTTHGPYFLIPQATRADYLWAYDIALSFPALCTTIKYHLMKCYTPVTIICRDTGAHGMYQIPASGVGNLETRSNLRGPASSLLPFPFSEIPLEACLIYIASSASRHVLTTGEDLSEGLGFRDCCLCPFCTTLTGIHTLLLLTVLTFCFQLQKKFKLNSGQLQNNLVHRCNNSPCTLYLSPFSREQQLCRAVLPSIEYLWVTGLRNSV